MNRNHTSKRSIAERIVRSTKSVWHCHLIGAALVLLAVFAVGMAWSIGMSDARPSMINGENVSLQEAANILPEGNRLQEQLERGQQTKLELDARSNAISKWLCSDVDVDEQMRIIRSIAEENRLRLVSITNGESNHGIRVSTMDIDCVLEGSFASLCSFMSELPKQPVPIDCAEIGVSRLTAQEGNVDCSVRLRMLVPYASPGTAAGKLISSTSTVGETADDVQ